MIIMNLALAVCAMGIVYCLWGLYCNEVTYKQRMKMLENMRDLETSEYLKAMGAFCKVDYDDHAKVLMRFKNPYDLYYYTIVSEETK